jgi:hypothetical protein
MEAHLATARVLGYGDSGECEKYLDEYRVIGRQLTNLIKYWRGRSSYQTQNTKHHS